jgi:methyl-accepting chemotaxis protein
MDQGVQQNAAMIEQATAVSHTLKTEIGGLVQMIGRFEVSQRRRPGSAAAGRLTTRAIAARAD